MYAVRVACCLLVSRSEYAAGTDRQTTDGRQTVTLRYLLWTRPASEPASDNPATMRFIYS